MFELLYDANMKTAGINFNVPSGFYICTENRTRKTNGLVLVPKEQDCRIDIYTIKSSPDEDIKREFIKSIKAYTIHGKIETQLRKYAYSISAVYEMDESAHFEIRFGQHENFDERMILLITVDKHKADIHKILNRWDIKELLDSFEMIGY